MRISDWSSYVCSSDLKVVLEQCALAIAEALRRTPGTFDQQRNAPLAVLCRVAVLGSKNVDDRNRLAGEVSYRCGQCPAPGDKFALAFGVTTLPNQSDLPP